VICRPIGRTRQNGLVQRFKTVRCNVHATVGYFVRIEFFFSFIVYSLLVGQLLVLVSAFLSCPQLNSLLCGPISGHVEQIKLID